MSLEEDESLLFEGNGTYAPYRHLPPLAPRATWRRALSWLLPLAAGLAGYLGSGLLAALVLCLLTAFGVEVFWRRAEN